MRKGGRTIFFLPLAFTNIGSAEVRKSGPRVKLLLLFPLFLSS
jgi:hypothetical protein